MLTALFKSIEGAIGEIQRDLVSDHMQGLVRRDVLVIVENQSGWFRQA